MCCQIHISIRQHNCLSFNMTKQLSSKIFSAVSFIKNHVLKRGYVSYTRKQMLSHLESFYVIILGLCDPLCMKQRRRRNPGLRGGRKPKRNKPQNKTTTKKKNISMERSGKLVLTFAVQDLDFLTFTRFIQDLHPMFLLAYHF